eukprot:TRINITY_DN24723_c0_g1_i1.p1 TRINITY_DN24723_c0_g1~~TRINITY_DN24723_c0_g1_i1.p1  ORF type:complete len:197 (+),score=9.19 TRINITY_DN24723_c0_g1_i1:191-781(+)
MAMKNYEGPVAQKHERSNATCVSYSLCRPSLGPSEAAVPMTNLYKDNTKQMYDFEDHSTPANRPCVAHVRCRNPLPHSGSRRDAYGCWSVGSEGHASGCCQGPCKDIRSGRGCTWGVKCKKCHHPHPEISSTSLRSKNSTAKKQREGLDYEWQHEWLGLRREDFNPRHYDAGFVSEHSNFFLNAPTQLRGDTWYWF